MTVHMNCIKYEVHNEHKLDNECDKAIKLPMQ